jgi:serine/threonine protein kinase
MVATPLYGGRNVRSWRSPSPSSSSTPRRWRRSHISDLFARLPSFESIRPCPVSCRFSMPICLISPAGQTHRGWPCQSPYRLPALWTASRLSRSSPRWRQSQTLARLQQANIAHRDIKPGNLYELNGSWLIGDFGLVALPDAEPLTVEGRQVGPAHYTAYEMILNPTTADPHPADVYSLGKTLWVLATDQKWPPEGHQPVGSRGFDVGDFRPHARAGALDREVDLMTQLHPEERPTKEQVARDLAAWGALATEPVPFDVTDARARLRIKLQNEIAQQDTHEQQKEMALAAVRRLQVLTGPLNDGLKNLYERTRIDTQSDTLTRNLLKTQFHHGQDLVFRWQRCTFVAPFEGLTATTLRMSRCLELFDDGTLRLLLMVFVGPEGVMGTYFDSQLEVRSAPVGSVEAEKMLEDGISDLSEALKTGIDVFVEKQPDQQR